METENGNKKTNSVPLPPYLSLLKLNHLVNLLSTRNFNEIKASDLNNYGFAGSDAYVAYSALKFLKVIDENGKVINEILKKFHLQGEAKKTALQEVVKSAYADLFNRIQEPYNLSSSDLHNELLSVYGLTPRIARTAGPAFIMLCEMVGFKEATTKIRNKGTADGSKAREQKKSINKKTEQNFNSGIQEDNNQNASNVLNLPFPGKIKLLIPVSEKVSQSLVSDEFREIANALSKYAKKFLSEPGGENVESDQ